jgi:hypothetical protein
MLQLVRSRHDYWGEMSQNDSGIDVEIQGNTMQVGNEMYHLGNISRVSTYTHLIGFHGSPLGAIWLKKWWIIIGLVLLAVGSSSSALLLLGPVVLAVGIAQIVRMLQKKSTEYVLRLESAGVVRGVLASGDSNTIEGIVGMISESIRNPPVTSQHMHLPNVRKIEKAEINQYGERSQGIVQNG